MKIAFFLLPKSEVIYLTTHSTMRQALERMEFHRYSAVPVIDEKGRYVGTITEGDLLWKLKSMNSNFKDTEKVPLTEVPQYVHNVPVHINAEMEDLLSLVIQQNFVPVVDDSQVFIGIIRRSEIIEYCSRFLHPLPE